MKILGLRLCKWCSHSLSVINGWLHVCPICDCIEVKELEP